MSESSGRSRKRAKSNATSDAEDGAEEVGSGLEITKPPKQIPHLYNNNYTVRLTYADNYRTDVKCDGTTSYQQVFRANSIYDPDYTGSGHQPYFRDTWASMYDYYSVLACKYTIRMYNAAWDSQSWTSVGTSGQRPTAVNVTFMRSTLAADFLTYGTIYPQAEMKNATTMFLTPDNTLEIQGTVTPGDFLVDAVNADSDAVWTAVGANPALPRFIGYVLTPAQWTSLTGANETPYASIQVQVLLEYTVQFTQVNPSVRTVPS
nr:Cap [Kummerowia striata CRESS virus]